MSRWCLLFCFQAKCSTCDTPLCMKSDFQREREIIVQRSMPHAVKILEHGDEVDLPTVLYIAV